MAISTREFLSARAQVDARSLATFRIGAALLMLADLGLRARNFSYLYTEGGVVPEALVSEAAPHRCRPAAERRVMRALERRGPVGAR